MPCSDAMSFCKMLSCSCSLLSILSCLQAKQSGIDTGMLDMSAFGMAYEPDEAADDPPASHQQSSQQQDIDSGMLDMSAFGMAYEPATDDSQQQTAQPNIDSGLLDISAFGLGECSGDFKETYESQQEASSQHCSAGLQNLPPASTRAAVNANRAPAPVPSSTLSRAAAASLQPQGKAVQPSFRQLPPPKPHPLSPLTENELLDLREGVLPGKPEAAGDGSDGEAESEASAPHSNGKLPDASTVLPGQSRT